MMKKALPTLGLGLILALAAGAARVDDKAAAQLESAKPAASASNEAVIAAQVPFYPTTECIVSGEALVPGEITDVVHEGRLVRFCCKMCTRQFEKDPAAVIAKLDQAAVSAQLASYPFEKCVISDEKLGSMGEALDEIHDGRLVRFCCNGCVKSFKKDSAKYFTMIDAAMIAEQLKTYTSTTCPVSGEPLGDGVVDHLYGTQLVRTCCKKCAKAVDKEPAKYLAIVASAK